MLKGGRRDKLLAAISSFYRFRVEEETDDALIMLVDQLSAYPEETFSKFVNRISTMGFVAFTGPEGSERIYVVAKKEKKRGRRLAKVALMLGSIATIIYTGLAYQYSYSGNASFMNSLPTVLLLFLLPLGLIVISREFGRFIGLRVNGMEYHLPIIVPDPLGMGVLGSIAAHEQPYVSRRAMFYSGLFPLISGFIASLAVVVVGSSLPISGESLILPVNSSFKSVSLPLTYSILLGKISPVGVTLNIMQYAGWIGIIINALNTFPIGFLDGGLISKALIGDYSKYASYVSLVGMVAIAFVNTSWFIPMFVLVLFVILIGINGPEPLLSISRLSMGTRVLTVVALLIFILSIVPFPYHVIPSNISVSVAQTDTVLVNGTGSSAKFHFTVDNLGSSSVVPAFTISPSVHFSVSQNGTAINPGQHASYNVTLSDPSVRSLGEHNFTVSVYSGTSKFNERLTVMVVNLTNQMSFNNAIPYTVNGNRSAPVLLNFSYIALKAENFSILSFAPTSFDYSVTVNNLTFHEKGNSVPFTNLFSILPGEVLTVKLVGYRSTSSWTVMVLGQNYNAALAYITLGG